MIKKVMLFWAALFVLAVPAAHANDGGPSPDYNEYITYTVETDCTEIGIGEELTFTITVKNHTPDTFTLFHVGEVFQNTFVSSMDANYEIFIDLYMEPYATNTYEVKANVGPNVWWYEMDGSYYMNLCPTTIYMLSPHKEYDEEKYGSYGMLENMVGVEPIPIKLNNLYDGSHLMETTNIDDNKYMVYTEYFSDFTEDEESEEKKYSAYTACKYSIKNISDETLDIVNIDGYELDFLEDKLSYSLEAGKQIIANCGQRNVAVLSEMKNTLSFEDYVIFKDKSLKHYFVYNTREYETKIVEMPQVEITATNTNIDDKYLHYEIEIKNISDNFLENFFVYYDQKPYYGKEFSVEHIMKADIEPGKSIILPENIIVKKDKSFNLLIGYWMDSSLFYWDQNIRTYNKNKLIYIPNGGKNAHYKDIYAMLNDVKIFNLQQALNNIEHEKRFEELMSNIAEQSPHPSYSPVPKPTSTISVEKVRSYYISPFIFLFLGIAATAVAAMVIISRRKDKEAEKEDK